MSGMELRPPDLRPLTSDPAAGPTLRPPPADDAADARLSELVADLIEATELAPRDRLALVRGRTRHGEAFVDGLVAEGLASGEGLARMIAARHGLPFVELDMTGVAADTTGLIPIHVLRRAVALPYRLDESTLHVAIADPQDVHAIDELRLATRYHLSLGVAPRDAILAELDRIGRVALAPAEPVEEARASPVDADVVDLEEEDGVTEGPIVRIVNSVILQAAEDGASDVHFEAQEDGLVVRYRIDGVLHEVQRIPKRLAPGVTTRLKVLAKLDIAE